MMDIRRLLTGDHEHDTYTFILIFRFFVSLLECLLDHFGPLPSMAARLGSSWMSMMNLEAVHQLGASDAMGQTGTCIVGREKLCC